MRRTARLLTLATAVTLGAGVVATAPRALAQSSDALQAERTRLRAQLSKVNAEIDTLKRAGGSVRDDYRLRARLADAESLARRLMEIEARLGIHVDAAPKAQPQPLPIAEPTDSPADLDAKADILADQSRRVRAQADAFARRASDAKGRQELRKRAADLDRDPFAPMEGSKRRVATLPSASTSAGTGTNVGQNGSNNDRTGAAPGIVPPGSNISGPTGNGATGNNLTPGATTGTPASAQLRDLLDTATLTDIRRIETSGAAVGSPQALDRVAAALRARADWLDAQARAMRARAQAK